MKVGEVHYFYWHGKKQKGKITKIRDGVVHWIEVR